jgi:hypothetical protein
MTLAAAAHREKLSGTGSAANGRVALSTSYLRCGVIASLLD